MKLKFSGQIFEKYSNIKFNENPYSVSRIFSCGLTDGQTRRRNFVYASKHDTFFISHPAVQHIQTLTSNVLHRIYYFLLVHVSTIGHGNLQGS